MPVPNDLETRPHFQRLYFVRSGGIKWPALLCSPSSKLEEHVKDNVARCQIFLERQKSQELEAQAVALFFGKRNDGTFMKSITNFDHETFDFIDTYNSFKKIKNRDLPVALEESLDCFERSLQSSNLEGSSGTKIISDVLAGEQSRTTRRNCSKRTRSPTRPSITLSKSSKKMESKTILAASNKRCKPRTRSSSSLSWQREEFLSQIRQMQNNNSKILSQLSGINVSPYSFQSPFESNRK